MALNKLSIDKVDVKGKRVLIRYAIDESAVGFMEYLPMLYVNVKVVHFDSCLSGVIIF